VRADASGERLLTSSRGYAVWRVLLFVAIGLSLAGCAPGGLSESNQTAVAVANTATAGARARTAVPSGRTDVSGTPTTTTIAANGVPTLTVQPTVASTLAPSTTARQQATPTVPSAGRRYTDPDRGFSFIVPDGWQQQQTHVTGIAVQYVADGLRGDVNIVTEDAPGVTLELYVAATIANIKRTYPDMTFDTKGVQAVVVGGKAAQQYEFSGTVRQTPIQMVQIVVINSGTAYVITFTVATRDAAALADQMNRMIRSFDFIAPDS
jgi:hypothetical protein